MNWRSVSLAAGILALVGGLATFSYGPPTLSWLGWTLTIFGAAAAILGLVPEQLLTIFKIPELRKKILVTLIFLAVYRIGYYVPLPMIDQVEDGREDAAGAVRRARSGARLRIYVLRR